jgi:hypothetical protein
MLSLEPICPMTYYLRPLMDAVQHVTGHKKGNNLFKYSLLTLLLVTQDYIAPNDRMVSK